MRQEVLVELGFSGVRERLVPVAVVERRRLNVLVSVQIGERGNGAGVVVRRRRVVGGERSRRQVVQHAGVIDARLGAGADELRRHQRAHTPRRRDGRLVAEQHLVAHGKVARLQLGQQVAVVGAGRRRRPAHRRRRQAAVVAQAVVTVEYSKYIQEQLVK